MSKAEIVDERIIQSLSEWLQKYKFEWLDNCPTDEQLEIDVKRKSIKKAEKEILTLNKQLSRTHDFLEQGVYDTETFLARSQAINDRLLAAQKSINDLQESISIDEQRAESRANIIPKVEYFLDVYKELPNPQAQNDLLKEILERVDYVREQRSPKNGPFDNFEITLYPKLPHE